MIGLQSESKSRALLLAFAAGASVLSASLANFLTHNDYPLLRADVAIVFTALLLIALALAPLYVGQRQWGHSLLDGILVAIFADFNSAPVWGALAAGAAVGAFGWWLKRPLSGPIAFFGAVVLATTIVGAGARPHWLRTERHEIVPPTGTSVPSFAVLHILLDEQAGPEGIYPDANGRQLRRELRAFFLDRGFTLYGRAYTEHMHTVNAIPAVLNYGARLASKASQGGVTIGEAAYFEHLNRQGFKIHILQSDFADLCTGNPISSCTTYDSSSMRPTLDAPLSLLERAQLISLKFATLSKVAVQVARMYNKAGRLSALFGVGWSPFEPGNTSRTSTVAALATLPHFSWQLKQARPGEAYFAHLLLPHYPHVVRADCSFLPWEEWELRRSNTPLEIRRRTYAEQDRCTLRKLDQMIRVFERSTGGKHGAIVVHGDHGSRIVGTAPVTDFVGHFTNDDVIAAHATLFAIRGPKTRPGYYELPQPTPALLRQFASTHFQMDPDPKPSRMRGYVMSNKFWQPQRRAELPRDWSAPSQQRTR